MSTQSAQTLKQIYEVMLAAYGPQRWWPARTRLEVVVGAILTQNTAWANVERAIDNLKRAGCLDCARLRDVADDQLSELIRPAGYFRVKSRRLRNFVNWLWDRFNGSLDRAFDQSQPCLREQLLSISGIGPETADSIILYAARKPTFVVDAYTARILRRHGLIDETADYDEIKTLFEGNLPCDTTLFNEYHALLVAVGKRHCRPRARCAECPLEPLEHDPTRP